MVLPSWGTWIWRPRMTPLSPTVTKVLDEYLAALIADEDIDKDAAKRLNGLLRQGKVPKFEDIQAALDPPQKEEK
jgi:hypothetical protein